MYILNAFDCDNFNMKTLFQYPKIAHDHFYLPEYFHFICKLKEMQKILAMTFCVKKHYYVHKWEKVFFHFKAKTLDTFAKFKFWQSQHCSYISTDLGSKIAFCRIQFSLKYVLHWCTQWFAIQLQAKCFQNGECKAKEMQNKVDSSHNMKWWTKMFSLV